MKISNVRRLALLAIGVTCLSAGASALTINRNFLGGTASSTVAGSGTLQSIFNAAADCWEMAIMDDHTLTLSYYWENLGGSTLGVHTMGTQGGVPHREISGTIRFNNATFDWYMDGDTDDHSEYGNYTEASADWGGGTMNVGRQFLSATGLASNRYDMFSVALHEIGHALGMSAANTAWQLETVDGDIDVTGPRPHAGADIDMYPGAGAHTLCNTCLMYPFVNHSSRNLISAADVLANAQVSQFTDLNLNPCGVVPEPGTIATIGIGVAALLRRRKAA